MIPVCSKMLDEIAIEYQETLKNVAKIHLSDEELSQQIMKAWVKAINDRFETSENVKHKSFDKTMKTITIGNKISN